MADVQGLWALGGGIASGKSEVRRLLDGLGVPTIDADSIGHAVLARDGAAFDDVTAEWPGVVVNGEIDRRRLGQIVFNDPSQLEILESITHPHIFDTIRTMVEEIGSGVVVELPVVAGRIADHWGQIVVDCRDEIRVQRAVGRGMTESEVRSRMAAQHSRSVWLSVADLVVPNHGSITELRSSVELLVQKGLTG